MSASVIVFLEKLSEDKIQIFYNEQQITNVTFRNLEKHEIIKYVETKDPLDKAGAYGIQGLGALLVEKIDGDFYNVVGLPVSRLAEELHEFLKKVQSK